MQTFKFKINVPSACCRFVERSTGDEFHLLRIESLDCVWPEDVPLMCAGSIPPRLNRSELTCFYKRSDNPLVWVTTYQDFFSRFDLLNIVFTNSNKSIDSVKRYGQDHPRGPSLRIPTLKTVKALKDVQACRVTRYASADELFIKLGI